MQVGKPFLDGASVQGEVLGPAKGKKLVVFRFHRRKNVCASRTDTGSRTPA